MKLSKANGASSTFAIASRSLTFSARSPRGGREGSGATGFAAFRAAAAAVAGFGAVRIALVSCFGAAWLGASRLAASGSEVAIMRADEVDPGQRRGSGQA